MAEDLVGKTLGNYRVESLLGSGGMGEVYRGVHQRLNRAAAIKVLHAYQAGDANFQARFLREARSAAALTHPNIVEVFDFGEQDGDSYLVMELVPDGSLRTLLRQRSTEEGWSLALGLNLVRQAAEGLAYAHAQGMVHRDIKPDNLLLRRRGEAERGSDAEEFALKISDFGLARLAEGGEDLTVSGMVVGTPTYMSPEQCQGAPLDGRSDLYSLGVVLYEVAVGQPPFRAKSLTEAVFKHISEAPVPPRQLRPDLPVALEDVILRCLAKRPDDRYPTANELIQDLEGALGDTEMNTIVGTSGAELAGLSRPTPVDPVAPTVVDSSPSRSAVRSPGSGAAPRPSVNASGVSVRRGPSTTRATKTGPQPAVVRPSLAPGSTARGVAKPPQVQSTAARGATKPAQTASANVQGATRPTQAPPAQAQRWPLAGEPRKPASAGALPPWLRSVAEDPRRRNIGLGVVGALVALVVLIVVIGSHTSAGAHSTGNTKPTATVAGSPSASPTPVDTVAFSDALSKNDNKWAVTDHSFFSDGGYQLDGGFISYAPGGDRGDVTIAVKTREIGGPTMAFYGMLLRGNGHQYYFFGIDSSQHWTFSLVTSGDGKALVAATTDSHLNGGLNATNTLTVRAKGGHFVFYANGAQLGQIDDGTRASGNIALLNADSGLHVVFNDFSIALPA